MGRTKQTFFKQWGGRGIKPGMNEYEKKRMLAYMLEDEARYKSMSM